MTTQPATLLTAQDARDLHAIMVGEFGGHDYHGKQFDRLQALADGRTACVERRTEDEHRAAFIQRYWPEPTIDNTQGQTGIHIAHMAAEWRGCFAIWLECARANGLVKP